MQKKIGSKKLRIFTDQKLFFNLNAKKKKVKSFKNILFAEYVSKEQYYGFDWISNCKSILDYGCGTGTSIDSFLNKRGLTDYNFYGVDIANDAIKEARKKYPQFKFYKIETNKIPQVKNNSLDAVIMLHVLHHSRNHLDIFKEIGLKLKKEGKFLINDLTSNNIIINFGRLLFTYLPKFISKKFDNDLVINGRIPEKYRVNVSLVISQLKKCGFSIDEIGYGHLFFFVFGWIEMFFPLSKYKIIYSLYQKLINFEQFLLRYNFFKKQAEVFYIKCTKK